MKWKKKKENLGFGVFSLLLVFLLAITIVLPKTLDIKHLKENDYSEIHGVLNSAYVEINSEKKDSLRNSTYIKVDGVKFKLNGNHHYYDDFLGQYMKVYYLPHSKYVISVEFMMKIEKKD